ncbi:MAG: response regulator, partial [Acidobacteria bacterium]
VLAIDDDAVALDLIRRALEKENVRVVTATSGADGLRLAAELRPAAITLDLLMAGMNGWTVLNTLKADPALADIPVVILTILDAEQKAFALGASEFLSKPVDRRRLASVLARYRGTGARPSVLLVDDDAAARAVLGRTLTRDGWDVREAENGNLALARIEECEPTLVLLDLMMPEMDGFEFLEALRARPDRPWIPVVVLTAKDLTATDRERLAGSVTRIVQKGAHDTADSLRHACDLVLAATRRPGGAG